MNVQPHVSNPIIEEVKEAIKSFKNNEAPEEDELLQEFFKVGGRCLANQVQKLIIEVWQQETIAK